MLFRSPRGRRAPVQHVLKGATKNHPSPKTKITWVLGSFKTPPGVHLKCSYFPPIVVISRDCSYFPPIVVISRRGAPFPGIVVISRGGAPFPGIVVISRRRRCGKACEKSMCLSDLLSDFAALIVLWRCPSGLRGRRVGRAHAPGGCAHRPRGRRAPVQHVLKGPKKNHPSPQTKITWILRMFGTPPGVRR